MCARLQAAIMHILNLLVEGMGGEMGDIEARFKVECELLSANILQTTSVCTQIICIDIKHSDFNKTILT